MVWITVRNNLCAFTSGKRTSRDFHAAPMIEESQNKFDAVRVELVRSQSVELHKFGSVAHLSEG